MPRCVLGVFLRDSAGVGEGAGLGGRGREEWAPGWAAGLPARSGGGGGCPGHAAPRRRDRSPGAGDTGGLRGERRRGARKVGMEAPASAGGGAGDRPPRPLAGFPPARGPGRRGRRAGAAPQPGLRRAPGGRRLGLGPGRRGGCGRRAGGARGAGTSPRGGPAAAWPRAGDGHRWRRCGLSCFCGHCRPRVVLEG